MEQQYNFESNLLKLSESHSLDECLKEWVLVKTVKLTTKKVCICNHVLISTGIYFYNKKTKQCCVIGSGCKNKFGKKLTNKITQKLLKKIIDEIEFNEYNEIQDVFEYSKETCSALEIIIRNELKSNKGYKNEQTQLNKLLTSVYELEQNEKFKVIIDEIIERINFLIELTETERLEKQTKIEQNKYTKCNVCDSKIDKKYSTCYLCRKCDKCNEPKTKCKCTRECTDCTKIIKANFQYCYSCNLKNK